MLVPGAQIKTAEWCIILPFVGVLNFLSAPGYFAGT
jgi:hypothetical protein